MVEDLQGSNIIAQQFWVQKQYINYSGMHILEEDFACSSNFAEVEPNIFA